MGADIDRMLDFLDGKRSLDDLWFGEHTGRAAFWWRSRIIPELRQQTAALAASEARVAELEAQVCTVTGWCEASNRRLVELSDMTKCTMGVGDGAGKLFVHGDYYSIKAAQQIVDRATAAESQVAELRARCDGLEGALRDVRGKVGSWESLDDLLARIDALLAEPSAQGVSGES